MNKIITALLLTFILSGCNLQEIRERGRAEIQKEESRRGYENTKSTYLTLAKDNATRCSVIVEKSPHGHYFDRNGNRAYDISQNLRSHGVRALSLTTSQTTAQRAVEVVFPQKNSFVNLSIRDNNGKEIKKQKVYFKVKSRHTFVDLKLPCSCYPRGEKPSRCGYKRFIRY
jgi:uncharacterized lipoprotein NlpE involved in copper resistance